MIAIISGSRDLTDYAYLSERIETNPYRDSIRFIVQGGARGVDALAKRYAEEHGILCGQFDADWKMHGKAAGPMRNRQMAEWVIERNQGCLLIAIRRGSSRGTSDMVNQAKRHKIESFVYDYDDYLAVLGGGK